MEILKNFGVNPVLLIAQIINFLIILYVLKRFAYKPIFKMLDDRKKTIQEGIENAKKSEEALEKALEREKAILQKAQSQAQEFITDAKNQAEEIAKQMEENTRSQADRMLKDAKEEIQREYQETEKRLATHTTQLAISILEKTLKDMLDEKEQKQALTKAIKKLKKV